MANEHEIYQELGRVQGKLETTLDSCKRAHSRIDTVEKDIDAAKENIRREFDTFKHSIFEKYTEFAKVQARHTVVVGLVCSIIAVVVAKVIGGH